ncbi:MAG: hypothetical protein DWQ34_19735 [Planctomycetota bacterium]|nr:MAG: hypothetical protein DWQ34_19735 [Planctomycetota bacterium]
MTVLCATLVLSSPADAQRSRSKTETRTGKVIEVQEQGRAKKLIVEVDGEQVEFLINANVKLSVQAPGDTGFVQEGQFVSATGVLSNEQIFIKELTVHLVGRGQKLPAGKIVKAPAQVGESQNAYNLAGPVLGTKPDEDYPDHTVLGLKVAGRAPKIMLEPDYSVTVSSSDASMIPADAPIEMEVAPLRGGRFRLVAATVTLSEPLNSEEVLGSGASDEAGREE